MHEQQWWGLIQWYDRDHKVGFYPYYFLLIYSACLNQLPVAPSNLRIKNWSGAHIIESGVENGMNGSV